MEKQVHSQNQPKQPAGRQNHSTVEETLGKFFRLELAKDGWKDGWRLKKRPQQKRK